MDPRYAQKIVDVATGELGKVSDQVRMMNVEGKILDTRFGWENLKRYFEVAGGFTDATWRMTGTYNGKEISYLDGVKIKNKRVPQKNIGQDGKVTWTGVQWCGIFATYCWMQAGVPGVKWGFPGVSGAKVRIVPDIKNPRKNDLTIGDAGVGDIVVMKDKDPDNPLVHHCIVTRLTGESFECVNGNSDYQGVLLKTDRPRRDIAYFYTYRDDFLKVLNYLYPGTKNPAASSGV